MPKPTVFVAMSGGVDSSVAAVLLVEAGYNVVGVTLRLWSQDRTESSPLNRGCCSLEDIDDARSVCQMIGAPHYVVNAEREFNSFVIDYFTKEYQSGRTPHPCIACNDRIKFDFLLQRSVALGAEYISTGHYARKLETNTEPIRLLKATDANKDQSYVLFGLTQMQLKRILLPVGWYTKEELRDKARSSGLRIADKPDSQEICFIPDGNYRQFLKVKIDPKPGDFVDSNGQVLGKHQGIEYFTIGQRRGINLDTTDPLYVIALDPTTNRVTVGPSPELYNDGLIANRVNWVSGSSPSMPINATVKIRYKSSETAATIVPKDDTVEIWFDEPQKAITPGQAVVFYQNDELLGGGFIWEGLKTNPNRITTDPLPQETRQRTSTLSSEMNTVKPVAS